MNIFILGGDGFCGWPTTLHLSKLGYNVHILDNLSRRKIDTELGVSSLTPIASIEQRVEAWNQISGANIIFHQIDLATEYERLLGLLLTHKPGAIVHFAEQRAAPYSMKNSATKRYTIFNNTNVTHNVLCAMVESKLEPHLVHLGTMGVYGYSSTGLTLPEGYLHAELKNIHGEISDCEILYPTSPGSIYHMTKCLDQEMFKFYAKNDHLRITDLHQGIVWGTMTDEVMLDERLINRFDYDGDYGTVLNRFLSQAAIGYPLTVHGTGGQTRAFIHIRDTVRCIALAIKNPPNKGERVKIFNQQTEIYSVIELAELVAELTGSEIQYIENPRYEAKENSLKADNENFLYHLKLEPTLLGDKLIQEIYECSVKYKDRIDPKHILCQSIWNEERKQVIEKGLRE